MEAVSLDQITQYDRFISKYFWSNRELFKGIDHTIEIDDFLQMGRVMVAEGLKKYDPNRGANVSTFIILYLRSKLNSYRKNVKKRHQIHNVSNMSDISGGWQALEGSYQEGDDPLSKPLYMRMGNSAKEIQDATATLCDANAILKKLNKRDKDIFILRFIYGMTVKDIHKIKDISIQHIRNRLRFLNVVFKTLAGQEIL